MNTQQINTPQALLQTYREWQKANPKTRIRQAAQALGCSEAELVACQAGEGVTVLQPAFPEIMAQLESLGKVMALTRNNEVVHERKGIYRNLDIGPFAGVFVDEDIDLRFFLSQWAFAFAVKEPGHNGQIRHSLQFFGKDGEAVHKIYAVPDTHMEAWEMLVHHFRAEVQEATLSISEKVSIPIPKPDSDVDVEGFQQAWRELQDTHDFYGLTRKHGLTRTQALRLAPSEYYASPVPVSILRKAITQAAEQQLPIMVFVGNQGMIQIHTGTVRRLLDHEQWFNVMDPDFNLHIWEPGIAQAWVVRKPTADGIVTSIECFNGEDELVVTLFGKRKPGNPELVEWQTLVAACIAGEAETLLPS